MLRNTFFAILLSQVLDGFEPQHCPPSKQCSCHLISANIPKLIPREKISGAENRTQGSGERSKYAIHCAMRPPYNKTTYPIFYLYIISFIPIKKIESRKTPNENLCRSADPIFLISDRLPKSSLSIEARRFHTSPRFWRRNIWST